MSDEADCIDVQPEHTGNLLTRRELGIYQLGHHQPPRSSIVIAPLEQRHRSQKDGLTAALRIFEQPQPATKEDARCRYVVQPWPLIQSLPGGRVTLSTLPANALLVNTNTPKTLNLDIEVNVQSSEFTGRCPLRRDSLVVTGSAGKRD